MVQDVSHPERFVECYYPKHGAPEIFSLREAENFSAR
jgi:hypothetical protein